MEQVIQRLSKLASRVATDFLERGGKLITDGEAVDAERFAAADGALGPLLWMANEFLSDYELEFASLAFMRDPDALAGFTLTSVWSEKDGWIAVVALTFADFLRNEVLADRVQEVDIAPLLHNFREWCEARGPSPTVSPNSPEGRRPE